MANQIADEYAPTINGDTRLQEQTENGVYRSELGSRAVMQPIHLHLSRADRCALACANELPIVPAGRFLKNSGRPISSIGQARWGTHPRRLAWLGRPAHRLVVGPAARAAGMPSLGRTPAAPIQPAVRPPGSRRCCEVGSALPPEGPLLAAHRTTAWSAITAARTLGKSRGSVA